MQEFLKFTKLLIIFLTVLWLFFLLILGFKMAPNNDMSPSIKAGDIVLYYKIKKTITENDVVAVRKKSKLYFSRVMAKPGDTVDIVDDTGFMVNGNVISSDKATGETYKYEGYTEFPLTLQKDEYFVLADQRDNGEDSRYFGPVKSREIKGIVVGMIRRSGF